MHEISNRLPGFCKWLASQGYFIYMEKTENPVGKSNGSAIPSELLFD